MAKFQGKTQMGGENERFPATRWTEISDPSRLESIKNELYSLYWKPLYCHLRRRGFDNDDAKDYTQSFLMEILYEKEFFRKADRDKGRFRNLLLTSFNNYVNGILRKKKLPTDGPIDAGDRDIPEPVPSDPNEAYVYAWATQMLDRVLTDVEQQCRENDLDVHWKVFKAKILDPIIDNVEVPPLSELCGKYDIENESKASNMIVTVKRRFQAALQEQLKRYATAGADLTDEFNDFLNLFQ